MKKILTFLFFALLITQSVNADNAWTVKTIPNTRLKSNTIHVSDPDGYLSESAENAINTVLCSVQDSVDVFLVTITSIGIESPKQFATSLFNHWGIGEKSKNNGMLLLFVENQHALEFETGYGIEPVMPDIECFRIFNKIIKPYFKNGDYQGGLCAGVCEIVRDFGGTIPEGIMDNLDYEERIPNSGSISTEEDEPFWAKFFKYMLVFFVVVIPFCSLTYYFMKKKYEVKEDVFPFYYTVDADNRLEPAKSGEDEWNGDVWKDKRGAKMRNFGCAPIVIYLAIFLIFGFLNKDTDSQVIINYISALTALTYLTWICLRQNMRVLNMANKIAKSAISPKNVYTIAKNYQRTKIFNYLAYWIGWIFIQNYKKKIAVSPSRRCVVCGEALDETNDFAFSDSQNFEKEHDILKYVSLRCPSGHTYVMKDKGPSYKSYIECTECHAHTAKKTKTRVVAKPTTSKTGLDEVTYVCSFCAASFVKEVVTPKIVPSGGGYSGGGYSSSGSSSSGSFGGGSSGGGGYSGRW